MAENRPWTQGPYHTPGNISGYTECHVFGPPHSDGADYAPICKANTPALARLFAAAPALYEALALALPVLEEELEVCEKSYLPEPSTFEQEILTRYGAVVQSVRAALSAALPK